jgi:hypothetical protein
MRSEIRPAQRPFVGIGFVTQTVTLVMRHSRHSGRELSAFRAVQAMAWAFGYRKSFADEAEACMSDNISKIQFQAEVPIRR